MKTAAALAAGLYGALLRLYPSNFRREFGDEMTCDFEEATSEAWRAGGWMLVLGVWTGVATDLIRSLLVQWLRSGVPLFLAASVAWTVSFCVLVAQGAPPRDPWIVAVPHPERDMQIMLVGLAVVVLLIVATVLITAWFWMSVVKRRSRA